VEPRLSTCDGAWWRFCHVMATQSNVPCILTPQLAENGSALIRKVSRELEKLGYSDMAVASADALIEAQEALNIRSIWLQMDEPLENWATKIGKRGAVADWRCGV
jgi:hypothetical protein